MSFYHCLLHISMAIFFILGYLFYTYIIFYIIEYLFYHMLLPISLNTYFYIYYFFYHWLLPLNSITTLLSVASYISRTIHEKIYNFRSGVMSTPSAFVPFTQRLTKTIGETPPQKNYG